MTMTPYNPNWNSLEACYARVQQALENQRREALQTGTVRPFSQHQHEVLAREVAARHLPNEKNPW